MEAIKSIYHPDNVDAESFIAGFTIRLKEFADIISTLKKQKEKPLQHFLIVGKRGMGKSTLLRRIFLEAEKPPISNKLVAIRLGTEQYKLSRLYKLWEEIIRYLSFKSPSLEEKRKALSDEKHYEESIIHIIVDYLAEQKKTLLLLIDNFDHLIEKLTTKEQHALRETLIQYPIQIIGNTIFYDEHFVQYNQPFYDFFKPVRLKNLGKDEANEFIRQLSAREGVPDFEKTFAEQKGKIQTLRILSGGVPRTLVILVSIISKKNTGNAVDYLHEMLEGVTGLYQGRMNTLSSQHQEIMHHLAVRWDRTPVKDLAKEMRVPSKSISAQLTQLENNGYINKISTSNRNLFYEIDERFFNIWLLMSEAAPYDTKRVIWLTRWLDMFYDNKQLEEYALWCDANLKTAKPKNWFLIAQALSESEKLSYKTKDRIVVETTKDLSIAIPEVKEWAMVYDKKKEREKNLITRKIDEAIENNNYDEAVENLNILKDIDEGNAWSGLGYISCLNEDYKKAEKYLLKATKMGHITASNNLGVIYHNEMKDYEKAEKYYLLAAQKEDMQAIYNLGVFYFDVKKDYNNAEKYLDIAADNGDVEAMFKLGYISDSIKEDYNKAEKYYLMAAEKGNIDSMFVLGLFYQTKKRDYNNAEKYFLMAIEKEDLMAMVNLGSFYYSVRNDYNKAEKYYLMASKRGDSKALNNLACLYFEENLIDKKDTSLNYIDSIKDTLSNPLFIETKIEILLWNEKFKESYSFLQTLLNNYLKDDNSAGFISRTLTYFLIFKQKQFLYRTFNGEHASLIDRFKPVYFALLSEMKDEFPNEYLRMPEELEEPVNDLLTFIKTERERLGI